MKSLPQRLELRSYLEGDARFSVARAYHHSHSRSLWHDHDFAELFWITQGKCRHILETGEERLGVGDVRFIRPPDLHCLQREGREPLHLTNISFPSNILASWGTSYPLLQGQFFWWEGDLPFGLQLGNAELDRIEQEAVQLASRTQDLLFLHHFLQSLFLRVLPMQPDARDLPGWLKKGLMALEDPEVLLSGTSAFARACGRSPEHVARECRKRLTKCPSELVNQARMRHASRQLRMTDRNILEIMYDCGLSNPRHFYQLFREHSGMTPRQYRLQGRALV